jgi:hypothetical protein
VSPLSEPEARALVYRAALTWSPSAVRLLAGAVQLGDPLALLQRMRGETEALAELRTGPRREPPTTSDAERAAVDMLHAWRMLQRWLGIRLLPPPGSVHDSIAALDAARGAP